MFLRQMSATLKIIPKDVAVVPLRSILYFCPCKSTTKFKHNYSSLANIRSHIKIINSNKTGGYYSTSSGSNSADSGTRATTIKKSLETDYIPFEDQTRIIQDVIDEEWNPLPEIEKETPVIAEYLRKRGKTGVFDIGELVEILREENGRDVCTIRIPQELDYADFMVIVTARSPKHMHALATFVRKRFKMKDRLKSDRLPRIGGTENSKDWLALDLGNIILHVFTQSTRDHLDLETLWTVGSQFDDLYNQADSDIVELLKSFK